MARPRLPGWPLEAVGNGGPREMITGPGNGASQNPAYRPSPVFSLREECGVIEVNGGKTTPSGKT